MDNYFLGPQFSLEAFLKSLGGRQNREIKPRVTKGGFYIWSGLYIYYGQKNGPGDQFSFALRDKILRLN